MISLNDQIKKFQNTVYNKELDDFIPIDDQFTGGGLTVGSLVKQNAFILSQIKKIKGVFINYCKLNQNVYSKIVQHELNIHNQSNKLNILANGIDRKLNETVKYVKQVYEDTLNQNKQSKNMIQEMVKPIEDEIKKKVDEKAFAKQIKLILQQYDQNGGQLSQSQGGIPQTDAEGNIIPRKRGKGVANQQFQQLKGKFTQLFVQVGNKFQQIDEKSDQQTKRIYNNSALLNKLNEISQAHNNQIKKLHKLSQEQRDHFNKQNQRITTQINAKTNNKVWQSKQTAFYQKVTKPKIDSLNKIFNQNQKQNNKSFAQMSSKLEKHQSSLDQEKVMIKEIESKLYEVQFKVKQIFQEIQEFKSKNQIQHKIIIQKVQEKSVLLNKVVEQNFNLLSKEIEIHKNIINNLSTTIEDTVVKGVTKKVMTQIKIIEGQILTGKNNLKNLKDEIDFQSGEINNIKQILSKKANFTDVLQNFQKKLDKQDMKQFMEKLDTAPSNFYKNTILNSQQLNRRTIISERPKPKGVTTRSFFTPNRQETPEKNQRHSTKLFMCGFDDEFDNKQLIRTSYTQGTRRKKMKSTTGILNALNL